MTTTEKFSYDNTIVRNFAYATMLWGVVGMLVGLYAAFQLILPSWNLSFAPCHFCICGQWNFYGRLLLITTAFEGTYV
jgi:cbb3-type cytochrome oxidase subunit 1